MATVLADPSLFAFIGGSPPSVEELRSRYRRWQAGSDRGGETWHNWIARASADGAAIGHLQATVDESRYEADVAWVVGTAWQGRGLASEAARVVVAWLEATGITGITAHIRPGHRASERVAERIGMVPTPALEDGERVWRRASKG